MAVLEFSTPNITVLIRCRFFVLAYALVIAHEVPLLSEVNRHITAKDVIQVGCVGFITAEVIVINAGTEVTPRAVQRCIAGLNIEETRIRSFRIGFFKLTVAARQCPVVTAEFELSTVKGISVLNTHAVTDLVIITTYEEVYMLTGIVFHISVVYIKLMVITARCGMFVGKAHIIRAETQVNSRAVVNRCRCQEMNSSFPRSVAFNIALLMLIMNVGIAGKFNIAYPFFQVGYTNTEFTEFVRKFIGQTIDKCTLFSVCTIFMRHSLCYHFGCFITSDITLSLEVNAVNALNDTGVSQFYYGIVCPAVLRDIHKGIGCKCRGTDCHGCY